MPTDVPTWMQSAAGMAGHPLRGAALKGAALPSTVTPAVAPGLRAQVAAGSHNVFRPDIYRVSGGYLN